MIFELHLRSDRFEADMDSVFEDARLANQLHPLLKRMDGKLFRESERLVVSSICNLITSSGNVTFKLT